MNGSRLGNPAETAAAPRRRFDEAACLRRRERFRELALRGKRTPDGRRVPLIKCCGMMRECDIEAVNAAKPDFCGFICEFPKSHRNVDQARLRRLAALLDDGVLAVAVCVDLPPERAAQIAAPAGRQPVADAIQLHGREDEAYIAQLRTLTDAPIVQAFRVHGADDVRAARASSADLILLDSGQGSGQSFDWSLIEDVGRPYLLAGGLGPDNAAAAIARLHPAGVDMSSGLETDRLKDAGKIARAVRAVHLAKGDYDAAAACRPAANESRGRTAEENDTSNTSGKESL